METKKTNLKKIFFVVGVSPDVSELHFDMGYPTMNLLSSFDSSKYAHNIKMYVHGSPSKVIYDPVYDKVFADNPDGRRVMVFMLEGTSVFITAFRKYLRYGKTWKRWDVVPYFQFRKGKKNPIVPTYWYSQEFKKFLYG